MSAVLVTGSRDWDRAGPIWCVLDDLLVEHGQLLVVHGAADGADAHADGWATLRRAEGYKVSVKRFRPLWGLLGRAAGPMRNAEMVRWLACERPTAAVHGFLRGDSRGTTGCLKLARQVGFEPVVHRYEDPERAP
jgi:hypothetical protein